MILICNSFGWHTLLVAVITKTLCLKLWSKLMSFEDWLLNIQMIFILPSVLLVPYFPQQTLCCECKTISNSFCRYWDSHSKQESCKSHCDRRRTFDSEQFCHSQTHVWYGGSVYDANSQLQLTMVEKYSNWNVNWI
jgi:hypothetical protein